MIQSDEKKWPGGDAVKSVDSIKKSFSWPSKFVKIKVLVLYVKQFNPQIHQKIERKTSGFRTTKETIRYRFTLLNEGFHF